MSLSSLAVAFKVHGELASPSLGLILLDLLSHILLLAVVRVLKLKLSPDGVLVIFPAQFAAEIVLVLIAHFSFALSLLPLLFSFQALISELLVILEGRTGSLVLPVVDGIIIRVVL